VEVDGAPATAFADRRWPLMVLAPTGRLGEVRTPHVSHFRLVSLIAAALGLMLQVWGARVATATRNLTRISGSESRG
jgi:hypothetical protein